MRLDIAAGTAVRFEPGQTRDVHLVALAGGRTVYGFRQELMGKLDKTAAKSGTTKSSTTKAGTTKAGTTKSGTAKSGTAKRPATTKKIQANKTVANKAPAPKRKRS